MRWLMTGLSSRRRCFASIVIAFAVVASALVQVAAAAQSVATPTTAPANAAIDRLAFTVDLGDFETAAEITYPAGQRGPFPTVLLIAGSGPADMDFTLTDFATGAPKSAIFRDIADFLSARGYAVVRYNKHYVTGSNDPQEIQTYYRRFTLPMLLEDANTVYEATRALPQVDPNRIVLYGWSEGSTIAAQLAIEQPAVAGLILQGALDTIFRDVFQYQLRDLAVNFLTEVTDANRDGLIDLNELFAGYQQHPGTVAGYAFLLCFDPTSTPASPRLNAAIDQNGDELLDISAEIIPFVETFFATFDETTAAGLSPYGPQYATDRQLPTILDSVAQVKQPIVLLHGENDANVPPQSSVQIDAALAEASNPDHTVKLYPELGHSLGPAATVYDDTFAPIASEPLQDVASWLDHRFGGARFPSPPNLVR